MSWVSETLHNHGYIDHGDGALVPGFGAGELSLAPAPQSHRAGLNPGGSGTPLRQYFGLQDNIGKGGLDYVDLSEHLKVVHTNQVFHKNNQQVIPGSSLIKFHFKVVGSNTLKFGAGEELEMRGGRAAIAVQPEGIDKHDSYSAGCPENSLTVLCTPTLLIDALDVDPETLPAALSAPLVGRDPELYFQEMFLSNRMLDCLREISSPLQTQAFRRAYLSAKLTELVCITLDELVQFHSRAGEARYRRNDIEALYEARRILLESVAESVPIEALARTVGINRTKLTDGFKRLFGETVHQFHHRERMMKAHALILEEPGSLLQIANTVGYSHQSTFSTAFKEYFGYLPSKARANRKLFRQQLA